MTEPRSLSLVCVRGTARRGGGGVGIESSAKSQYVLTDSQLRKVWESKKNVFDRINSKQKLWQYRTKTRFGGFLSSNPVLDAGIRLSARNQYVFTNGEGTLRSNLGNVEGNLGGSSGNAEGNLGGNLEGNVGNVEASLEGNLEGSLGNVQGHSFE